MKYSIQIGSVQSNIDATDDYAAVDSARESHVVPPGGGDFEVVVTALESCMTTSGKMRPPGEVSRFTVRHEATPEVRKSIERNAEKVAQEAERERIKEELRSEIPPREAELAEREAEIEQLKEELRTARAATESGGK